MLFITFFKIILNSKPEKYSGHWKVKNPKLSSNFLSFYVPNGINIISGLLICILDS